VAVAEVERVVTRAMAAVAVRHLLLMAKLAQVVQAVVVRLVLTTPAAAAGVVLAC